MRFLLDANLSPGLVEQLEQAGHTAVHVAALDMLAATDDAILDRAASEGYVLITSDSDFPMLLAVRRETTPSVVLLRHVSELPSQRHGALLVANLPAVLDDLDNGAIVSLSPARLRVRRLPID